MHGLELHPPALLHRRRVDARERVPHDDEAIAVELPDLGR
jgi:hypothetical protein